MLSFLKKNLTSFCFDTVGLKRVKKYYVNLGGYKKKREIFTKKLEKEEVIVENKFGESTYEEKRVKYNSFTFLIVNL